MNSNMRANIGIGSAIAYFTKLGYIVSVPLTDSQNYDLVVDIGGLKKVQVKTTAYKQRDKYVVSLATKGGNRSGSGEIKRFDSTCVDILYALTADDEIYVIPTSVVDAKNQLVLGHKYAKYLMGARGIEPPA